MSEGNRKEVVVDTNVAVVANQMTPQASINCISECITRLRNIIGGSRILLDEGNLIIREYRNNLSPSGQPGAGDYFFKWLFDNQANPEHCRKVTLTPNVFRGFEEFPDDSALDSFDPDDRKFVAVVLVSGTGPKLLNASDTDWWLYRNELQRHGVEVVLFCPDLMPT